MKNKWGNAYIVHIIYILFYFLALIYYRCAGLGYAQAVSPGLYSQLYSNFLRVETLFCISFSFLQWSLRWFYTVGDRKCLLTAVEKMNCVPFTLPWYCWEKHTRCVKSPHLPSALLLSIVSEFPHQPESRPQALLVPPFHLFKITN